MFAIDIFQDVRQYFFLCVILFTIAMMSASITINDLNVFGTLKVKRLRFICKSIFNRDRRKKAYKSTNIK